MTKTLLILVKKNNVSGNYGSVKNSGLYNSSKALKAVLQSEVSVRCFIEICVDANDIDKYLSKFKPQICLLEALWVTPEKMEEIVQLYPKVTFFTRIHSRIPFLAQEGIAIEWIKKIGKIDHSYIACNNYQTHKDFKSINIPNIYMPNLYKKVNDLPGYIDLFKSHFKKSTSGLIVNIGGFGAIRPLKNQLLQAVAAISYAEDNNKDLYFHINGDRVELNGESVLKNIRALFKNTKHTLVEHPWMDHDLFMEVVSSMDICLQVSFTESFNIVAADAVYKGIPIVVSEDISWASYESKVDANSVEEVKEKIESILRYPKRNILLNKLALHKYNTESLRVWKILLNHF
ncbi:MAG: hypothetical protein M3044_13410 [Thermoproteota archaeon]|nr:hypothetical protein [Thermoproteota archaeon]